MIDSHLPNQYPYVSRTYYNQYKVYVNIIEDVHQRPCWANQTNVNTNNEKFWVDDLIFVLKFYLWQTIIWVVS